jgi:outer membrane protein assembly factor BamD (BamD/ComL family)
MLFANAENTIITRDSLLQFANLDEDALLSVAQGFAEKAAEAFEEERRKLAERQAREAKGGLLQNLGLAASRPPSGPSANWYFYNSNAFTQGQLEFKRVWGNRQLQDNWRRSSQGGVVSREQTLAAGRGNTIMESIETEAEPGFDKEGFIAEFIAMVPRDEEMQVAYLEEVEAAMFEKARTLRYEIQNLPMAWKAYEAFIQRFPYSEFLAEALYSMTLLADDMGNPGGAEQIRERILNEYPNSLFALAIINPGVLSEDEGIIRQIQEIYANAYRLYESGLYLESKSLLQSAFLEYPPTEFSDRLRYLELMNISKTDNEWVFRQALTLFLRDFPDSDLTNKAQQAEDLYAQRRLDKFLQVENAYKIGENAPFYLMIAFPQNPSNREFWVEQVVNALSSLTLNVFIRDSYAQLNQNEFLLIISGFDTWEQAIGVVQHMKTNKNLAEAHPSNSLPIFAIDNINFERLYNQKDVQEYLQFFNENYPKQ